MRRLVTLTLVVGLVALAAAALVDWLRDPGDPRRPIAAPTTTDSEPDVEVDVEVSPTPPVWVEDRTGLADRFERNGIRGSLYLSADGCARGLTRPLRVVRLPRFHLTDGPRVAGCAFTVSADGGGAAGRHAAWSPSVPVFATQAPQGRVEVVDAKSSAGLTLPGSAPAFKPDGSLTHALAERIVAWSNHCADAYAFISPPISFGPEEVGPYCSGTAVSRRELRSALPEGDRLTSVEGLAWLDGSRLLAILQSGEGSWIAAYEDGRSLGTGNGLVGRSTTNPLADPTGRYVALTPSGYLEVYDRDRGRVWASSVSAVAFDWSPDGDWLAYAADDRNVYFLRTSDWTTRFSLQADTDGLAWR